MRSNALVLAVTLLTAGLTVHPAMAAIPDGIIDSAQVNIPGVGNVNIVARLDEANGAVAVCGLYFFDEGANGTTKSVAKQVLQAISFSLDGKSLGVSASKFKLYPSLEAAQSSGEMGCAATKRAVDAVKKASSFKMKLNSGAVVQY